MRASAGKLAAFPVPVKRPMRFAFDPLDSNKARPCVPWDSGVQVALILVGRRPTGGVSGSQMCVAASPSDKGTIPAVWAMPCSAARCQNAARGACSACTAFLLPLSLWGCGVVGFIDASALGVNSSSGARVRAATRFCFCTLEVAVERVA